jgi:hypothetical protein
MTDHTAQNDLSECRGKQLDHVGWRFASFAHLYLFCNSVDTAGFNNSNNISYFQNGPICGPAPPFSFVLRFHSTLILPVIFQPFCDSSTLADELLFTGHLDQANKKDLSLIWSLVSIYSVLLLHNSLVTLDLLATSMIL